MAENETANDEIARTDAPESADRSVSSRKLVAEARKEARRIARAERRKVPASAPKRRLGGVRAVGTAAAVCALIAGVAIPAFAATQQSAEAAATATARDEAAQDAQSFAAGEEATGADIAATSYSARTADEIAQAEAERLALERAEEERQRQAILAQQQQQQQQQQQNQGTPAGVPDSTAPQQPAAPAAPPAEAQGGWINPLGGAGYYISRSLSSGHDGTDMVTTSQSDWSVPIYAAKSGTVVVSSEAHYGWGVAVQIDHGDGSNTLYGHMTYGSRQVQAGQYVEQGQIIGYVGSTGRSTAHHLHLEVRVNGQLVEPRSYLPIG